MGQVSIFRRLVQAWSAALDSLLGGSESGQVPIWDADTGLWHLEQGGYLVVEDVAERDALPDGIRHVGLEVFVLSEAITYKLRDLADVPGVDPPIWAWVEGRGIELAVIQQAPDLFAIEDGWLLNWDPDFIAAGRGAFVPVSPGSQIITAQFEYDQNTSIGDPGSEQAKYDDNDLEAGTTWSLSNDPIGSVSDLYALLSGATFTTTDILIQQASDTSERWVRYTVTAWTPQGTGPGVGWNQLTVTHVASGPNPDFQNGQVLNVHFTVQGGGSVTNKHSELQDLLWPDAGHTGNVG
ncbi:MAG: hypothetical protein DRQ40_10875, partial [Gammaproteobacteria bacterium]